MADKKYDFSKPPAYRPTLKGASSEDALRRRSAEEAERAQEDLRQQLQSPNYDPGAGVRPPQYASGGKVIHSYCVGGKSSSRKFK